MSNVENNKIKKVINFYMLANRLKYISTDKEQSLADEVYGAMILAIAINSEYIILDIEKLGLAIRVILLSTINEYCRDTKTDSLSNNRDLYLKTRCGHFALNCITAEIQLEYFFEQFLKEENIKTDNVEELYNIAKNLGILDILGNDNAKNFNIFHFYYLNRVLKKKVRSGWDSTHWNISNERVEKISEHCVGTVALALGLDSEFDFDIDINKVIYTLVVHEIGEIIIGDITPFDGITPEEKKEIEHRAIVEIASCLSNKDDIINSIFEFDARMTNEAKYEYHCDKLEADIQSKVYQDMGCHHPLNEQDNNVIFKSSKVQQMMQDGATNAFDIWYEWDKSIYFDDPVFTRVLNYVKDNTIK